MTLQAHEKGEVIQPECILGAEPLIIGGFTAPSELLKGLPEEGLFVRGDGIKVDTVGIVGGQRLQF
jgi:hypothetical protein